MKRRKPNYVAPYTYRGYYGSNEEACTQLPLTNEHGAYRRQSLSREYRSLLLGMQCLRKQWQAAKVGCLNDVGRFFIELNTMDH
jgi:hypothetical protein